MDLIVQDRNLPINKGCISVLERPSLSWAKRKFIEYCEMNNIDLNQLKKLQIKIQNSEYGKSLQNFIDKV